MNSPFANIFLALQDYITTTIPAIPYVDMDYGQLEINERPGVAFPGVLIDFPGSNFSDFTNLVQQGDGTISFKLFTNPYSSSSNITPDTYKQAALSIFDLEQELYVALEGLKIALGNGHNTAPLGRISYGSDNRRPGMKVRILTFSLSFQDYTAKRTTTLIAAPPPAITDTLISPVP